MHHRDLEAYARNGAQRFEIEETCPDFIENAVLFVQGLETDVLCQKCQSEHYRRFYTAGEHRWIEDVLLRRKERKERKEEEEEK